MNFQGYRYTYKLNASHSTSSSAAHSHTFFVTMYIKSSESDKQVELYRDLEAEINSYFNRYSGFLLNAVAPFDKLNPTIENMAETFFAELGGLISEMGFSLFKLEVSENPQCTYSVSSVPPDAKTQRRINALVTYIKENPIADVVEKPIVVPEKNAEKTVTDKPKAVLKRTLREEPLSWAYVIIGMATLIVLGFVLMTVIRLSGHYPLGTDIHGHLFKSELMYNEIGNGNLYPRYTEYWYNGLQPYRYWPPMTYYFMALLQWIGGGSVMNAYLGFIWSSFVIGGTGWLLFGRSLRRPALGAIMSILWFFLPDNVRVFFGEGNMPRMFITMLLPLLFYFIWQFVCYEKKKMLIPAFAVMLICVFAHLMISAMIGVGSFVFLLIFAVTNRKWKEPLQMILAELFSFAVAGIWVYPALVGGITAMDSEGNSELMASLASKLSESLNPFLRLNGGVTELYLGVSIAIISLIGLIVAGKRSKAGFLSLLIVIAGTTTALTPIIQKLPMSQLFWIRRFMPIAYAMFVIALLEWKNLRKPILAVMCAVMLLDFIPSLNLAEFDSKMNIPATVSEIEHSMYDTQITQAKNITKSRISIMDLSSLGPMPSYAISGIEPQTDYVFGWAWQGASTAENIVAINEALEREDYIFMFDRNKELGADSVIVSKNQLLGSDSTEKLYDAAEKCGYKPAGETEKTILFSLYASERFGVVTDYTSIAIGTNAALIPTMLPYYREGDKLKIDEYTVDELSQYENIYLSGFFYNSKENAEQIVRELSDKGINIFIDMSRIPSDPLTNRMTFLDVSAQPILFYDSYPELITPGETYSAVPFTQEYSDWNTVYLNGLEKTEGWAWFEDTRLDFLGKGSSENITFIGFNLLFHSYSAGDAQVYKLVNSFMNMKKNLLPERELVPITVSTEKNRLIITTDRDNVNTTIAWQDNFESDADIRENLNLLTVDKGTTVIEIKYPYFYKSLAVTIVGIILEAVLFFFALRKKPENRRKEYVR